MNFCSISPIQILLSITALSLVFVNCASDPPVTQSGESIFFDKQLSINKNQSCASCHGKNVGWTGPDEQLNKLGSVYEGSIAHHFGNRKPPSS